MAGAISDGANRWRRTSRDVVEYIPRGDTIPDETWRGRHRNIVVLLLAHVPFLFLLGTYQGTESTITGATIPAIPLTTVLLELGIIVGLALLASWSRFGRRTRTALATTGLVTACAVLIHFSGGYIEAHFHFFVVMAVVAVYEDWFPFLLGIAYVVVQHGYFGMINPSRVYNHSAAIDNPWAWALIHGAFVLGLAAALMAHWYSTERSREKARDQLEQAQQKSAEVESLEEKNAEIEDARAEAEKAKAEAEARQREVEELNEHLEAKADAYSASMARAADGELGVRLDAQSESEAMTQIAESFNEMMDETESAMRDIQAFADEVAATTEEANTGASEIKRASEEVSESVQEISGGADEQREMLEEVSTEMNELSATTEEVAASAETVAETSKETARVAGAGETTAQGAIEDARKVRQAIDSTVDNVETLDEQMVEIGDIVGLIGDIAEQTNMLALNANIEAARAGNGEGAGGGEGFAVVADEVKQLAEETQASASDIEQLIAEVQAQTETTVEEVQSAQQHVAESVEAVEEVVDALSQVAENAEETDSGVQEISDATDDQAASAEEAVSMVEAVADISQTTADEAESVSAAAEQQASSMAAVDSDLGALAEQAEQLQALLSTFEVGDGADAGATAVALEDGGRPDRHRE